MPILIYILIAIIIIFVIVAFLFMRSSFYYREETRHYQCGCIRMSDFIEEIGKTEDYTKYVNKHIERYEKAMEDWDE